VALASEAHDVVVVLPDHGADLDVGLGALVGGVVLLLVGVALEGGDGGFATEPGGGLRPLKLCAGGWVVGGDGWVVSGTFGAGNGDGFGLIAVSRRQSMARSGDRAAWDGTSAVGSRSHAAAGI
jgi:hypothetical protein